VEATQGMKKELDQMLIHEYGSKKGSPKKKKKTEEESALSNTRNFKISRSGAFILQDEPTPQGRTRNLV